MSEEPIIAIVPAAGVGERARTAQDEDRPKQYKLLRGQAMLRHAVCALLADARVAQVRVAVSAADAWADEALQGLPRTVIRRCGGATRAHTVENAVRDAGLAADAWVLVHDAARPGLPASNLAALIDACRKQGEAGLLALPVADTVKRGQPDGGATPRVAGTLDRDGLWLAQTPQMIRSGVLLDALAQARAAGILVTDESQAMEVARQALLLVRGSIRNFKVTWPEDFDLMEKWL